MEPATTNTTDTRVTPDDGSGGGVGDWYCLKISPAFECPDCGVLIAYVNAPERDHAIMVWPERDDPVLLRLAIEQATVGAPPTVKPYEDSMGPCVSWYASRAGHGSAGDHL